jgi:uncharacterized protein YfdQ (DUF2303 family)
VSAAEHVACEAEAAAVAALAFAAAEPSPLDTDAPQAVIVPEGATLVQPDVSAWRQAPVRPTGVYRPATVDSFAKYVAEHQDAGRTTVWVHPTDGLVQAILDDNGDGNGYGQHRAVLTLTRTPEWLYWAAHDGELMSQLAFAELIEGGVQQIEQPDAADLLELAQSFHATNQVTFRSSTRLATGEQQLQYDEEIQATAGRTGQLTIPTVIVLVLSPFLGEPEVQIAARFRFRINAGKLQLGYKLDQPEKVTRDALEAIAVNLGGRFDHTYIGEPKG